MPSLIRGGGGIVAPPAGRHRDRTAACPAGITCRTGATSATRNTIRNDSCLARPGVINGLLFRSSLQAAFASRYNFAILLSQDGLPAAFAIIGALIGAPLVAREVEQRIHLAAWTQSVSRRRWYITKTPLSPPA
jgi:hypothetical protein